VRGKAVPDKAGELLAIISDVLTSARLDNRERIKQMLLEEKAGFESSLSGRGNGLVASRLNAALNPASWANEASGGIEYLFFLRNLIGRVDSDWAGVHKALTQLRDILIDRNSMIANVTTEAGILAAFQPQLEAFVANLPANPGAPLEWPTATARSEGLTFPGQVNYVAKGANLYPLGYRHTGASAVALLHLNTTYMWDRVRVQGGAYGGSAGFDPFSGSFMFTSYRDPNLLQTIDAYDGAAAFLAEGVGDQDLVRSIIGAIGSIDTYRLPDAKGFISLMWEITGNTDENRQQRREEVLGATAADFKRFGEVVAAVKDAGKVAVLGSEAAIRSANDERGGFMDVTKVL
jgi:Zn-dependent M16 (insulinase) family peptidase